MSIKLDGIWKIYPDQKNVGEKEGYYRKDYNDESWYDANVPGHWQEEVEKLKQYSGVVWYRKKFSYRKERKNVWLKFNGVFYKTTVWLNENKLGVNEGYFSPFKFNISNIVEDENIIAVKVESYDEKNLNKKKQVGGVFYHWDCRDPHFNPGGIWRSVEIYETGGVWIDRVKILTEVKNKIAKLRIIIWAGSSIDGVVTINIRISPKNFEGKEYMEEQKVEIKKGQNIVKLDIDIEDPALWWTWDLGPQNLYLLEVAILEEGEISDKKTITFGIRHVHLERSRNGWILYLNGKRLFIRGTNYGPTDQRIAYVTEEKIRRDVEMMRKANINMVRIHAQINPETLRVFDEYGILVWQDMPLQWMYAKKIRRPAEKNAGELVKIVENHPSVAIINCHNEPFKIPTKKDGIMGGIAFIISLFLSLAIGTIGRRYPIVRIDLPFWENLVLYMDKKVFSVSIGTIFGILLAFIFLYTAIALAAGGYEGIILSILVGIILPWDIILFLIILLWLTGSPIMMVVWNWNKNVLDKKIEEAIRREDMNCHPIVRHSGMMGWFRDGTDIHIYDGWYTGWLSPFKRARGYRHVGQFKGIFRRVPRFVSEYGAQSFPEKENLYKMLPEGIIKDIENKGFRATYKSMAEYLKKHHQYQPEFMHLWINPKKFDTIEEFIEATQEYQAELIKFYNEYWRSRRYNPVGGALQFMFTDIAPLITWAIVDYWRKPKKAYFALQQSFRPTYIFMEWPKLKYKAGKEYNLKIFVVNDLHKKLSGKATVEFEDKVIWEKNVEITEDSLTTYRVPLTIPRETKGRKKIALKLQLDNREVIVNEYMINIE